ncbi:hypothetical protein FO519_001340 [Halicephalobus sp. NKZ332]|nr:hypothetical protein FO519_001340 [Halicephalobus sp. NKZ332]
MPSSSKLDSETFGSGYGTNGNAVIVLGGPEEKKHFPQKSISFEENDLSRESTTEKILDDEVKKKNKKHGELYYRMSESFGEFAGHTSSHGIPRAYAAPTTLKRVLWLFLFILCLCFFLIQASLIVKRFFRNDIIVGVELKFENIEFPSVTVCNLNPYKNSLARSMGSVRDTLLAFDTAIEHSMESQTFRRRKRTIEKQEKHPETGIVQVSCSMTSEQMYFSIDEPVDGRIDECYCLHNYKNGYNYDCDLMGNWKQEECKCDGYGICEKETSNTSTPCLCRADGLCAQNEYDVGTGSWPIKFYSSLCDCKSSDEPCTIVPDAVSSPSLQSCFCANPQSPQGTPIPYCAPASSWTRSKCTECNWQGECLRSYSSNSLQECLCHRRLNGQEKCLGIDFEDPINENGIRVRRQVKRIYEKIYNRYDGLLAVYSICECHDGQCSAFKDDRDGSVCLCFFNRKNGQIWPCYPPEMWTERKCQKCSPLGDCIYSEEEGQLPCVCAAIIRMCVRIEERASTEVQPFEDENSTSSSRELVEEVVEKEKFKLADVIPKIWEITTTEVPIPEDVQEKNIAYGFKGVSDPVAIRAKASENLVFAVSSLNEDQKSQLSYTKKEFITKCSFNGRQCLRFQVFVNISDYLPTTESAGVRLTVHSPKEQPFPDTLGYSAPTGFVSSFGIRLKRVNRLPTPYGDCAINAKDSEYIYRDKEYSTEGCQRSCIQRFLVRKCGCGDPRFPMYRNFTNCPVDNSKMRACLRTELKNAALDVNCVCKQPCAQEVYSVSYSCARWPASTSSLSDCDSNLTPGQCLQFYREQGAFIEVYFEQLNYESLMESEAYGFPNLLSDFGGQLGLWMGVSVITIMEFLLLLGELLWRTIGWCCCKKETSESFKDRRYSSRMASRRWRPYPNGSLRYQDMLPRPYLINGGPYKRTGSPPLPHVESGYDIVRNVRKVSELSDCKVEFDDLQTESPEAEGLDFDEPNSSLYEPRAKRIRLDADVLREGIANGVYELEDAKRLEMFKKVRFEGEVIAYYCALCEKIFSGGKRPGGSIYNHVKNCSKKENKSPIPTAPAEPGDRKFLNQLILKAMAEENIPASFFSSRGFRAVARELLSIGYNAGFQNGSKNVNQNPPDVEDLAEKSFPKLQQIVEFSVKNNGGAIVVDVPSKLSDFNITIIHMFTENWKLVSCPIDIRPSTSEVVEDDLTLETEKVLQEYNLRLADVVVLSCENSVFSNSSSNIKVVKCAGDLLHTVLKRSIKPKKNFEEMMSQDVVTKVSHVFHAVSHVKEVIQSIRERPSLHYRLSFRVTPDEEFKWLNKLDLVRKFLALNTDDIEMLEQELPDQARNHLYRANAVKSTLNSFIKFSEMIEKILIKLTSEDEPTIHLVVPLLKKLEQDLERLRGNESSIEQCLAKAALVCLRFKLQFYISDIHIVAALLDPRGKSELSRYYHGEERIKILQTFKNSVDEIESSDSGFPEDDYNWLKNLIPRNSGETDLYLGTTVAPDVNYEIISWWKINENFYPRVAKLAKKVLSVPATGVSVDRLFRGTNYLNPKRSVETGHSSVKELIKYKALMKLGVI